MPISRIIMDKGSPIAKKVKYLKNFLLKFLKGGIIHTIKLK